MGVCDTVASLAEAVALARNPGEPRHRLLLQILRLMPLYHAIYDLSAWEAAFQGALLHQDDESEIGKLLDDIFELGRHNMYCAFDVQGTAQCYQALSQELKRCGVPVPAHHGLLEW